MSWQLASLHRINDDYGEYMFYGRESELERLNEMYNSNQFEFAVVYGRRRVGKTTLIREFCKDKKSIYYVAKEVSGALNLKSFSHDVYSTTQKELVDNVQFSDWDKAFDYIANIATKERIILAIDEYPYLAGGYKPISSILQAAIDHQFKNSNLFLILCGSSMSFMENLVLGYESPLYGRRTAQFKIEAFDFFDSVAFVSTFDKEEQAIIYGFTGGIPEYLEKVDKNKSLKKNIIDLFLTPSGHLYEEPANLIKQELRELSTYNVIIESIAKGASKLNEIAAKSGNMPTNKCAKYLNSLLSLGIVKKDIPITEKNSKKTIYLLNDQMFRFWYRFVFPNMSNIVSGFGEEIYEHDVKPYLTDYMGLVFEQICISSIYKLMGQNELPFFINKVGKWWGNNPILKKEVEIDILAFRDTQAIFGECKWKNTLIDIDVYDELYRKSQLFNYDNVYYYLYAKKGFTKRLNEKAANTPGLKLIEFKNMY